MKCPKCNVELDFYDCFDLNDYGDCVVTNIVGGCPNCDKEYTWERHYTLVYEGNLEESN